MGSLPSIRATGHKVWSRIRPNLSGVTVRADAEARLQALRIEVERLSLVRSNVERAAQLARVLDAVSAVAATHGLTDAELSALRGVPRERVKLAAGAFGLRQQLKQRASDVVAQVVGPGTLASITELAFGGAASAAADAKPVAVEHVISATASNRRAGRSPFVLRVGAGRAAGRAGMQLIAASLLHLPRLHRQLVVVRRSADLALQGADLALQGAGFALQGAGFALQTAKLVRLQAANPVAKGPNVGHTSVAARPRHTTAASLLLWSSRSGLQLTYEIATAGAQLLLRRYVLPRVLRYLSSGVTRREVARVRLLRPLRPLRTAR